MKLSGKDFIVTFAALSVISGASYGLYRDYTVGAKGSGEPIGTITFKKKRAERMISGRSVWDSVEQNNPIYNFDSIRTTEGSSAVIKLKNNAEISLEENTLVIVALDESGAVVDFTKGSVYAKQDSGALSLRSEGSTVSLSGGALTLTKGVGKEISVNVSSGSAMVTGGGNAVQVNSAQKVTLEGGKAKVSEKETSLVSPLPGAIVFIERGGSSRVLFSWNDSAQKDRTVEVSKSRSFTDQVVKAKGTNSCGINLARGDYFWRISNAADEVRSFSVTDEPPVSPLSPADGERYVYKITRPAINLVWNASSYSNGFTITIAKDPDFAERVFEKTVSGSSFAVTNLEDGGYYWKVAGNYSSLALGFPPPQSRTFVIEQSRKIPSPDLLTPEDNASKGKLLFSAGKVSFSWKSVSEAESYRFEIARDRNFSDILVEKNIKGNSYSVIKDLAEGEYYWRVTTLGAESAESDPSMVRMITATGLKRIESADPVSESSGGMRFRWTDPNGFGNYLVEIARDKNFIQLVQSVKSSALSAAINSLPATSLYFRVSAVGEGGEKISTSEVRQFVFARDIAQPVLVSPINNKIVDVSGKGKISFVWKGVPNATSYKIEVFKYSVSDETKVFSGESKIENITVDKLDEFSYGSFYWQVCSQIVENGSVVAASKPVKGYFSIPAGPKLSAPKVGTIQVYVE